MEYLNVSIVPANNENTIYFYGKALSMDCQLLYDASHVDHAKVFLKTREAMQQLLNRILVETHINLFVEQIDFSTYGAIHGFLESKTNKKENHPPLIKRLMVWIIDRKIQDCRAFWFYEI